MTYTINKETERAYNITADEVTTWIPKAWVAEDGSLKEKALDKIADEKDALVFDLQKNIDAKQCIRVKETEKAVNLLFVRSCYGSKDIYIWVPKSMFRNMNFVNEKLAPYGERIKVIA